MKTNVYAFQDNKKNFFFGFIKQKTYKTILVKHHRKKANFSYLLDLKEENLL